MRPLVYNYRAPMEFEQALCRVLRAESGGFEMRAFPDGETYVRVLDHCQNRPAILVAGLRQPDPHFLPLALLGATLRDLGAWPVILAAPYLPYMRQDSRFRQGEGVTSRYFAALVSEVFDGLVTIEPHLHRYRSLEEIYAIPTRIARATEPLVQWLRHQVPAPLLIGPDAESAQWVGAVARSLDCPVLVLQKTRLGDREVRIQGPDLAGFRERTPILLDDIVSTGRTMLETARQLQAAGLRPPLCIGIHGLFAPGAFEELSQGPIARMVTGNGLPHPSNGIHLEDALAQATLSLLEAPGLSGKASHASPLYSLPPG